MTFYPPDGPGIEAKDMATCRTLTERAVWIDLLHPTREEELALEEALRVNVPTREEMQSIELSSRLRRQDDTLVMTNAVLVHSASQRPETSAVTFIIGPEGRLITVRYTEPSAFRSFRTERDAEPGKFPSGRDALLGLIDAIVERLAEVLEKVGGDLDQLSADIFRHPATSAPGRRDPSPQDYRQVVSRLGRSSDVISRARESLVDFGRLVAFYGEMQKEKNTATAEAAAASVKTTPAPIPAATPADSGDTGTGTGSSNNNKDNGAHKAARSHLRTVAGDVTALADYANFLSGKLSFLLDATLGLIANEQNGIIKILSVVAVVFGPPTLIASIYGMNFEHMPELKWLHGYPFALTLMIASAVLPYLFFKYRGWL